ncbi:MAG TPA: DUF3830 family protein [bacterium]|nr:DUF3830 family protein [bacterium]
MRRIVVEFDDHAFEAVLLDEQAPIICTNIWNALPLEGPVTNTKWSGDMLRLWVQIPEPPERENMSQLQNPGDIIFLHKWNGLRFVYGQALMGGPNGAHPTPLVGRMLDGVEELAALGKRVEWEGARTVRVRRA